MNVLLTPELDDFVENKVKSGIYNSASEVIRDGLRLLKERDLQNEVRAEELRLQVCQGFAEIEQGQFLEFSSADEIVAHITSEARNRLNTAGHR